MRTQVTVYLDEATKVWLQEFSSQLRLKESEIIRLLLERERQIGWLPWSLSTADPEQGPSSRLPREGVRQGKRRSRHA